jgi:hypothetical protein
MHFRTFLKTGVEVLHLGGQHWENPTWPIEHWRSNTGRWRLFTPAIDDFLNEDLIGTSFGPSVNKFVLLLEVADFEAWGEGVAFTGAEGFTRYKPKTMEVWSVGRIDWKEVQNLPARKQLQAFDKAARFALTRVGKAKRRPKDFDAEALAEAVSSRLRLAKVSALSRSEYVARSDA